MTHNLLRMFDKLRAEDEPWLERCFVEPAIFERVAENNSIIVFGDVGAGKTALYERLKHFQRHPDGRPTRLYVDWRLTTPGRETTSGIATVAHLVEQLYDLIAIQLVTHLASYPAEFEAAPRWAQERVGWFVHTFLHGAPVIRLGQLLDQPLPGVALVRSLLGTPPTEILYEDAPPEQAIRELSLALEPLGLSSIWVMLDDIERLMPVDQHYMVERLLHLLSTLVLFERSELAFKLFVPSHLIGEISRASSLERRRIESVQLRWSVNDLTRMVERRLQLVMADEDFNLASLCSSPHLLEWLQKAGGASPRHWLDQVQPLVQYYVAYGLTDPIPEETWQELRSQHPPRFYLLREKQRVVVGGKEISLADIPVKALDMLEYLYNHGNQVVSKPELYYRAYLGEASVPRAVEDKGYKGRKEYEGIVDTNIYRLRKAIEPFPNEKPVLLQTVRGHGLRLQMRW